MTDGTIFLEDFSYSPAPLAQKPSNGVLASGDTTNLCDMVKYHPSSNIMEQ